MRVRTSPAWLVALPLVLALAVASGCGPLEADSEDGDPGTEGRAAERERGERADPEGEPGREPLSGAAQRLLDACEEIARRAPTLSEETRESLIADCEAAASGDERAIRRAAGAACDVIAAATVPWPARGPAADACRRTLPGAGWVL